MLQRLQAAMFASALALAFILSGATSLNAQSGSNGQPPRPKAGKPVPDGGVTARAKDLINRATSAPPATFKALDGVKPKNEGEAKQLAAAKAIVAKYTQVSATITASVEKIKQFMEQVELLSANASKLRSQSVDCQSKEGRVSKTLLEEDAIRGERPGPVRTAKLADIATRIADYKSELDTCYDLLTDARAALVFALNGQRDKNDLLKYELSKIETEYARLPELERAFEVVWTIYNTIASAEDLPKKSIDPRPEQHQAPAPQTQPMQKWD